jgi:hypothetical protein
MSLRDQVGPVLSAQLARLNADAALLALLGGAGRIIRRYSVGAIVTIPGVYWHFPSETPGETSWEVLADFDVWADTYSQARQIGARLIAVMHKELPEQIGGTLCFSQLVGAEDLGDPGPDGVARRLYRFRWEPVRDRAAH